MQHGIISRIAKLQGTRANSPSPDYRGLDLIRAIGAADTPELKEHYENKLAAWQLSRPELQGEFPVLDAIAQQLTKELV